LFPPDHILRRALLAGATCLCLLAPPAVADREQETIVRDDAALGSFDEPLRQRSLDDLRSLGVDTVHHIVGWRSLAPSPGSSHRPGFDASNPADYPPHEWDRVDALVRSADARGLDLILAPAGPAPRWAEGCGNGIDTEQPEVCKPDVREFQFFVIALAKRYSGTYDDENGGVLPRVDRWSVWNEPNQGGWLQPQWERKRGRWSPTVGHYYRRLYSAAARALRKYGHRGDQIMMGETAPLGRDTGARHKRSTAPLVFWRAVLCIDEDGDRLRGDEARNLGCSGFDELDANAVAHHPYTRGAGRDPRTRAIGRDDVTLAYHRRLRKVFDQGARLDRNRYAMPFYITEYGFQTDPPDGKSGVRPSLAAKWLNESNWIAYNNSRIKGFGNYELYDERDLGAFQTGLRFRSGAAKPSYQAFRMPIWVLKSRRYYRIWGQVRPARHGETVDIEYQSKPGADWKRVRTIRITNPARYIDVKTRKRSRKWRLRWRRPGVGVVTAACCRPPPIGPGCRTTCANGSSCSETAPACPGRAS
jgi:hypothetical protein